MEARLDGLERIIADQRKDFKTLACELREAIEKLHGRLTEQVRTPWPTLVGATAVIISIVALGMSGYVRDQGRIENAVVTLTNTFMDHKSNGHPKRLVDHASRNSDSIAKLMTLVLETNASQATQLDEHHRRLAAIEAHP
jgi:hypothetical protein